MWAFFSARLRMWLVLAVGAPLLGWLLGKVGDIIEARHGPTRISRGLQSVRRWLWRRSRGPFAARPQADPTSSADPGTPAT